MAAELTIAGLLADLGNTFGVGGFSEQSTADGVPTVWVDRNSLPDLLEHLKSRSFSMLYDLTAVDERERQHGSGHGNGFTLVYHLLSVDRAASVRIKVSLPVDDLTAPTVTPLWPAADWYEREAWDMFGITFEGHPNLRRILLPPWWKGHALRKDHPARATEMGIFSQDLPKQLLEQEELQFKPEEWGLERGTDQTDYLFLNLGPQHPGTHGVLRVILQLDGEEVLAAVPDIGYHHRGAEKMGERQSWHTYIPYTDRIDYLAGVLNELPYLLSVEQLAGIDVPERAKFIRVMLCELYRIGSHLVWYGTFAQDLGAMSPVFYMFNDRERMYDITSAFTGARMHPGWFRIGGVAADLPEGWDGMMRAFVAWMRERLPEYDRMVMRNRIFKDRTVGVSPVTTEEALAWGMTGPMLRATGLAFDLRKARPYAGYDRFDFDIPTARDGDCYSRALVRVEEMRQSLRILEQCIDHMPAGEYRSHHHLATPPEKPRTMQDIETLITHFLGVSWGPVIPPGEAEVLTESAKGATSYYLTSDGSTMSYRTRIRTPSFAHLQTLPLLCRGGSVADVLAVLGSIDFVLADVDR